MWIIVTEIYFIQKKNPSFSYEVIIVDDGSKDKTTEVCKFFSSLFLCPKYIKSMYTFSFAYSLLITFLTSIQKWKLSWHFTGEATVTDTVKVLKLMDKYTWYMACGLLLVHFHLLWKCKHTQDLLKAATYQ